VWANRSSKLVIMTSHYSVILHINSISRVQTEEAVIKDETVSSDTMLTEADTIIR